MSSTKERFQNPVVGDTVNLRLYAWNANTPSNFQAIEKVDIYFLDQSEASEANPDGRTLTDTFPATSVQQTDTGSYLLPVSLAEGKYVIGRYVDVWTVIVNGTDPAQTVEQCFELYPQLWYTSPMPVVYDFSFHFQPNKIRKGSVRPILIEIRPNVPRASDLKRYYENLAIVSDLSISIEQLCGDCLPREKDLRLVVENDPVQTREKRLGYYQLDTTDMDCGIYNVWFNLALGGNTYVSDKMQLQIFD